MSLPPPLASIRVVGPDGRWTPEALQFLLEVNAVNDGTASTTGTLQEQITALTVRVAAAEATIAAQAALIEANEIAIAANAADIATNAANIAINTAAIADHELRIVALEP